MSYPNVENFQPPPPPPMPVATRPDGPQMSTPETLTGIFFEPGRTFEALRARPRFLVAALIMLVVLFAFNTLLLQRVGYENIVRAAIESNARVADMPEDQRERIIQTQMGPAFKTLAYVSPVIGLSFILIAGAALYMLGAMVMARKIDIKQALAVWTYSSFPPILLTMVANLVLLFVKSVEDIDLTKINRGLVHANPGVLVDSTAHPVLATAASALDLFSFYGLFLAALGLRKVAKMSAGAAWGIVLGIWLIGVIGRLAFTAAFGSSM